MRKQAIAFVLIFALFTLPATALGATTLEGTVVAGETVGVLAPFGGMVSAVTVQQGDMVALGDALAQVETTKVYAPIDGTVRGVFGQPGDSADDVATRSGAVLSIEPTGRYTVTADIQKAYNSSDNKYVNIGETVYLKSLYTSNGNTATGEITATSGTTYTVQTTSGELLMGETVVLYRSEDYTDTSRIGRGTVSRTPETAVSGSGSIVALYVANGDAVTRGQLLFETVTGTLDGLYATGNTVVADAEGIVAAVNISTGGMLNKGDTVLTLCPREHWQVEMTIDEYDLAEIAEGDSVTLTFGYDEQGEHTYPGTVALISHISASTDTSDVTYQAYVNFTADENIRLGMTAVVTVSDASAEETDAAAEGTQDATVQPAQ